MVERQQAPVESVVLSGSGEFLGNRAVAKLEARIVCLSRELGKETSEAAAAHALAYLVQKKSVQTEFTNRAPL